ncbi:MAG: DHH family phosphoesterase [Dysosmobacter sp.]|jgi:c-di-AMP phosphodiesterase-like protein|uniref:DHH family phosphoesterase n=1 Tax=Dysosmobacter sp. TaxID=2591382 RepID=UPI0026717C0A|nr:DHH family phosphoesterase [Dysosmobacter sp.]MBS1463477.1 DHH family phosphoesterase [Oscillibacter sp.]MCI6016299.1 DHH family phosphoesterase [Dysosmobacter sp.]MCI7281366.1 DHH family phosphoesterase [Dysosmobacter sp.]
MSNKKLSRLLEPNLKFYFAVMLLFAVAAIPVNWQLALAEGTLTVLLYFYFRQSNQKRRQGVLQYIDSVTGSVDTASKSTLINSPLPTLVFRPDTGEIIWSNESFLQLAGVREHLFEMRLSEAVPDFQVQWLLSGKQESPERVELNNHRFRVYGSLVRSRNRTGVQSLVATTYWVETTEADHLREVYEASRPVAAILMLDNYEDLMKACEDTQRSAVLAQIDEKLQTWANAGQGILLKTDRNHYLFLFEEQYFQHFVDEKFSILDTVRAIRVAENIHPTLSIGIGKDSPSIPELYKNAKLSLEMALSRGGDQAVVRNQVDFAFYGGRTKATEKRTKVKSRVMANAFRELIADAGEVYIMGHSFADMDAVGAAAGICCAARKRGKQARIVIDREHTAAETLIARLDALPEYSGVFLTPAEAFLQMRADTLLVVVDTNRPDMVENPQLLESCNRVAVIDHHRRAATYIENAAFNFHEPYASSASELVTELLQYLVEPTDLLREEAGALLAGIVLDTKHFTQRTGGRTFEAAAFLRRSGADTAEVQRLFQGDLKDMVTKYDIIRRAEMYRSNIAVSVVEEPGVDRVAAAQAADDLLTLKGVQASFVIYAAEGAVLMSARSLGEINVQVILEALGGGGNSTTAGARIEDTDPESVRQQLIGVLDAYFEK